MSLTKKQMEVIDALQNGAHIWQAANTYYLARVTGHNARDMPIYKSEVLSKKSFDALRDKEMITSYVGEPKKWRLKL